MLKEIEDDLALQRKKLKQNKSKRKALKKENLNADDFINLEKKLTQESYNDQFFYKELVAYYEQKVDEKRTKLAKIEEEISTLKKKEKPLLLFYSKHCSKNFNF
ncbi:hypothetical protein [Polaribacter batillariae]|uniref:hypothetical protein n=1 Tax=Polaribacter batillariae TaxID=2808900 RepID=UPI00349EA565